MKILLGLHNIWPLGSFVAITIYSNCMPASGSSLILLIEDKHIPSVGIQANRDFFFTIFGCYTSL